MPLTSSMEDYLEAIYILFQKQGYVRCVDVAEYLEVTKPSVSRAVKELTLSLIHIFLKKMRGDAFEWVD